MMIGRWGLKRCIWPLALAQNLPNLLYMLMAVRYGTATAGSALGASDLRIVTALIVLEQLGAGMGTSAFMVFIMRTTKPAYKAANMAVATGLMTVAATFAGVFSGFIAEALGFSGLSSAYFSGHVTGNDPDSLVATPGSGPSCAG